MDYLRLPAHILKGNEAQISTWWQIRIRTHDVEDLQRVKAPILVEEKQP